MSTPLRGPPKPRDERGPEPPDAWTFVTFAAMMLVVSGVIIGVGGILHGFPTFSEPAEPEDGATGDEDRLEAEDEATDGTEEATDSDEGSEASGENDADDGDEDDEPLFGGGDG